MNTEKNGLIKNLRFDLPASIVVFFVALPLCLGIALASGAPLFSGLIAGIVGGIVVGALSGSSFGVSGPAAGLVVIVLHAIKDLGTFEAFLVAIVLAGIFQVLLGLIKAGFIAYYFPSSVIKGMLSGIGIIIFMKQIPHAIGYDKDVEGDFEFFQMDGHNTFSELYYMLNYLNYGAVIITLISLAILILWEKPFIKKIKGLNLIPGSLLAVITSIFLYISFRTIPFLALSTEHIVQIPLSENPTDFFKNFAFPDFSRLADTQIYLVAITIAVVASLETLLCTEATDKLDPHKHITPTNRELMAQGAGNIISGLIGGLPVTQVIVRSSANIQAGAQSKVSAIAHGLLLLLSVMFIPFILNLIPLACLASILLLVGYKLAKPSLIKSMYTLGIGQFVPFAATVLGIVFTDLLIGIGIGLVVSILFILYSNFKNPFFFNAGDYKKGQLIVIELSEHVTFLNKASILQTLNNLPNDFRVLIDASHSVDIDYDVWEIIADFKVTAAEKNIDLTIKGVLDYKINKEVNHVILVASQPQKESLQEVEYAH